MKRKILSIALLLIVLLGGLYSYRLKVAQWSVQKYLSSKGIDSQFTIDSFGFKEIRVSNILLDNKIHIEMLGIELAANKLHSLHLKMDTCHFVDVQNLSTKLSQKTGSNDDINFKTLHDLILTIQPLKLNLEINKMILEENTIPIGFIFKHNSDESHFDFELSGRLKEISPQNRVSIKDLDYQLAFTLEVLDKELILKSNQFNIAFQSALMSDSGYKFNNTKVNLKKMSLSFLSDDTIRFSSSGLYQTNLTQKNKTISHFSSQVAIDHKTEFGSLEKYQTSLSAQNISFKKPYPFDIKNIELSLKNSLSGSTYPDATIDLKNLTYFSEKNEAILNGIHVKGSVESNLEQLKMKYRITDENNIIHLSNLIVLYDLPKSLLQIKLQGKNEININNHMSKLTSLLKHWELSGEGKVLLSGDMAYRKSNWVGLLKAKGNGLNLKSKFFKISNGEINSSIKQYPDLLTHPNQTLKIKNIEYGTTKIENLVLDYSVKKQNKASVNKLDFNFEKASLSAQSFQFDLIKKQLENFKINISQYDLEKVLKLPLGESVTAKGMLDGFLYIEYKNNVPLFKGELHAQKNGWIRYRNALGPPKDLNTFSANPMDILNSYLYDFYYEDLDLDFHSLPNYDLNMTLRTLGKNPQYLKGKPLKLKINLEQNLLAAFKAMMLTYDMPKRIQEKIEEMGEK